MAQEQDIQLLQEVRKLRSRWREMDQRLNVLEQRLPSGVNETPPVLRLIRWFDRQTEELAGSAPLHGITLPELQRMFNVPAEDPMHDCFSVGVVQPGQLQANVDVPIDLDKYHYFVEVDALT